MRVTIDSAFGEEKEVAKFHRGQFFGEVALMKEDLRTANVYSVDPVTCYILERKAFTSLIGNLTDAKKENPTKSELCLKSPKRTINPLVKRAKEFDHNFFSPLFWVDFFGFDFED